VRSAVTRATPPDPSCRNPPTGSSDGSLRDQAAADAAYDRVDYLVRTLHLAEYSGGYVNVRARQAVIYWVGPVPAVLRTVWPGVDHGTVVFHSAPYTFRQMTVASERVAGARLGASDPPGYVISGVAPCVDGTGIRVEVADPTNGDTPPKEIPASLIAKIKNLADRMPTLVVGGSLAHAV